MLHDCSPRWFFSKSKCKAGPSFLLIRTRAPSPNHSLRSLLEKLLFAWCCSSTYDWPPTPTWFHHIGFIQIRHIQFSSIWMTPQLVGRFLFSDGAWPGVVRGIWDHVDLMHPCKHAKVNVEWPPSSQKEMQHCCHLPRCCNAYGRPARRTNCHHPIILCLYFLHRSWFAARIWIPQYFPFLGGFARYICPVRSAVPTWAACVETCKSFKSCGTDLIAAIRDCIVCWPGTRPKEGMEDIGSEIRVV